MKKTTFLLLFLFSVINSFGQIIHPAKWTFSQEDNKNGEYTLIFKVKIDPEWHMYSQFTPDGGPQGMVFNFKESDCYKRVGKVTESKPHIEHDDVFMVDVWSFESEATFKQKIKLNGTSCVVKGNIDYQVCKQSCIYEDSSFTFKLGDPNAQIAVNAVPDSIVVNPAMQEDTLPKANATIAAGQLEEGCGTGERTVIDKSLMGIFIGGLLGGLVALAMPCLFPMIPMTVTFFLKDNQSKGRAIRNAIIFGVSIITIYTLAGTIFALALGAEGLNALATHWAPNLFVFAIFIVFALSFLGLFEINAPYKLVNKES